MVSSSFERRRRPRLFSVLELVRRRAVLRPNLRRPRAREGICGDEEETLRPCAITIRRSGSPQLLSVTSASMSSGDMSEVASLPRWLISVRVLVRSSRVERPSVAERRRIDRWFLGEGAESPLVVVREVDGGVLGRE